MTPSPVMSCSDREKNSIVSPPTTKREESALTLISWIGERTAIKPRQHHYNENSRS
jgi:hypothetical protein